ncbi:MAG: selenocysteine-specific translation elongation factor [Deltaproteobacteria bacterium]|nr:selenocysteine-specific translation elongation factor [Deltaproteobacteria bacterium]
MSKYLTAGIAGHVDHGKTCLVKALTGVDTDRLQIEKQRGLSIESGIAPLELSSGERMAIMDVPGHTDFLKNTIRGLSTVDLGILVVAADDGVMPQTLEHIQILDFFGAQGGFIVLSKADLVDRETVELAELEIRELTEGTFLEDKPVIPFSSVDQRGMEEIRSQIEASTQAVRGKENRGPFRCWIDQIKAFSGFGTVVSGTVLSGRLRRDDPLQLLPPGTQTRARSLEAHHEKCMEAVAGQRVGINLHRVRVGNIKRGMVLAEPGSVAPTYLLNVDLRLLERTSNPLKNRQRVKLYLGTSVINARVVLMEKVALEPGERALAQFRLMKPVAALPGDPFVICLLNIPTVIGGGSVIEIPHEKYRPAKAATSLPYLKALQEKDLKGFMAHRFSGNPFRPVTSGELARDTGFPVAGVEAEIKERVKDGELISFKGRGVFKRALYQELKETLPQVLENILREDPLKMAATAEEIRKQLSPSLDEAPFQRMCAELCNEGRLTKVGGSFKIPSLSVKVSQKQEQLMERLLDFAGSCGFVPFSADTFWKVNGRKMNKNEIQRLLDYLHSQGRLVRLNNRRFLTPQTVEVIKSRVRQIIDRKGCFTLADCKEVLGYGRTVGVPVLEHLDAIGFTRREGDKRVLIQKNE